MSEPVRPETVPHRTVGAGYPSVAPGADPKMYGTAQLSGPDAVEARSFQTFTMTYTVGSLGLDDTGSICVCFRVMSDFGKLQTIDPIAPNYVSATTDGGGRITLIYDSDGGQRPWNKRLVARLDGGFLNKGEKIIIKFGDTTQGSPGMVMQTFAEMAFEFRVMVDVVATRHYHPLPEQLTVPVIAGPVDRWCAVLPTLRRLGEAFQLGIKAEDKWGNPTGQAQKDLRLVANMPVEGLPDTCRVSSGDRAVTLNGLRVQDAGTLRIKIYDGDVELAESGPLIIREGDFSGYWGDMHGQSGETVGVGRAEHYFDFARNMAFLDATSHQANDFQINAEFWDDINKVTAAYDEPGRFVALPGYEWSGNTAVGGDHNVFFRHEGRMIRRSSHALLADMSAQASDANTLKDLYASLKDEDCVLYAHVGGRYANIKFAHDPILETAFELHSAWGSFEWMLTDAFEMGYRTGVVCNSDGHKGRPGASYPGAATFGSYGGLTCFLADTLDRDGIFKAMRARHHYGTTGVRMHLAVGAEFDQPATFYHQNPDAVPDTESNPVNRAIMGDIVGYDAESVKIGIELETAAPIERVELRNGKECVQTFRPYGKVDLGNRIRTIWSGAEYRGRGRNTTWLGRADFGDAKLTAFNKINAWNPERMFEQRGTNQVIWDAITTGNFMGFDTIVDTNDATLNITTNRGDLELALSDIGMEDTVLDAGGLARQLKVFRLPEVNPHRSMDIEFDVPLTAGKDNPIWVCVTTEDGHQAWSSPIYVVPLIS